MVFLVFQVCFPNGQGLPAEKVSIKRWISYLIQIDGSPFQSNDFVCVVGDCIMRHGVNLAAHLQLKNSPKIFKQANKATIMSTLSAQRRFLLSEENQAYIDDPAEVKALCKQVVTVSARTVGSPYKAINYRRQMFAGWAHLGAPCVF
jgi:hypothetical protein